MNFNLEKVIADLRSSEPQRREEGRRQLAQIAKRGLTDGESSLAVSSSLEGFPVEKQEWDDSGAALIRAAATHPTVEGFRDIRSGYEKLALPAKAAAFEFLINLRTPESLKLFCALFARDSEKVDWSPGALQRSMAEVDGDDILYPLLVNVLSREKAAILGANVLLDAAENKKLPPSFFSSRLPEISAAARAWGEKLSAAAAKTPRNDDYRWTEDYRRDLEVAEYFPDLLGYAGNGAEEALRGLLGIHDPRISFFAIRSLLRLHRDVQQEDIDLVASDDEMRNMLFDSLSEQNLRRLFPKKFLTQEAFARSDMVRWLIYPTELGRAPNQIELMKVVDTDSHSADGVISIYLFRFRTTGSHWAAKDGWMAGIAGGYRKAEIPTTRDLGQTFSTFAKWDSKTPEQHVRDVTNLIESHWKQRAAEAETQPGRD